MRKAHWVAVLMAALTGLSCSAGPKAPVREEMSLAKKAELFEHDLRTRFMLDGQVLCKLITGSPEHPFVTYNMPDNAYMTGIHLGTLSFKYAATKDAADRTEASQVLRGLDLLCTVSGKKGLLARAAWPVNKPFHDDGAWYPTADGRYQWRGDVSSDQMTGVMYGYALAHRLVANDEEKKVIARNVGDMVGALIDNGFQIIDITGKPTQWGNYRPDYVKFMEKMNALLLLQHLKVAAVVTGDPRFEKEYRRLAVDEGYADVVLKARSMGDPLDPDAVNHSDDVLIFLGYFPLLMLEKDPTLIDRYKASLRRTWEGDGGFPGVKPEGNPFYAFIVHEFLGDGSMDSAGIETLRRFPLDMKWNRDTIAGYEQKFGFKFDPAPVSPKPQSPGVVPIDWRPKTWSAWVQNPYEGPADRTADARMEYNGHDYLMAYWLGRYKGFITPDQ